MNHILPATTREEIFNEKIVLKHLRGDFEEKPQNARMLLEMVEKQF